jgi:hypothetical protein
MNRPMNHVLELHCEIWGFYCIFSVHDILGPWCPKSASLHNLKMPKLVFPMSTMPLISEALASFWGLWRRSYVINTSRSPHYLRWFIANSQLPPSFLLLFLLLLLPGSLALIRSHAVLFTDVFVRSFRIYDRRWRISQRLHCVDRCVFLQCRRWSLWIRSLFFLFVFGLWRLWAYECCARRFICVCLGLWWCNEEVGDRD